MRSYYCVRTELACLRHEIISFYICHKICLTTESHKQPLYIGLTIIVNHIFHKCIVVQHTIYLILRRNVQINSAMPDETVIIVGFTSTVVNEFCRFLSQFSTNFRESLHTLFSIHVTTLKISIRIKEVRPFDMWEIN